MSFRRFSRAALGASAVLGVRQVLVQGIGAATGIALARMLTPSEFGVYAICTFTFYLLLGLGDLGLGAGIVRQKEEPSNNHYRLALSVRQTLDLVLLVVMWIGAPHLSSAYELGDAGVTLFRLLPIAALIQSFQIIPTVALERGLRFEKIAIIEIGQTLVYTGCLFTSLYYNQGIASFAIAWIGFSIAGALLAYAFNPWKIGWHFCAKELRKRLPFSLPYQLTGLTTLLADGVTPILVGFMLGTTDVGYINWATMLATFAVLGLGVLQRVYFSAFSKLQKHPERQTQLVESTLLLANSIAAGSAFLILVFIDPITVFVFGEKWFPALPVFYILWFGNPFLATTIPLTALLNSLGESQLVLRYKVLWTALNWSLAAPLIFYFGPIGFACAILFVQCSHFFFYRSAQKLIPFKLLNSILLPWLVTGLIGALIAIAIRIWPVGGVLSLLITGGLAGVVYLAAFFLLPQFFRQIKI